MKFSHNWLNQYLSDTQTSKELAETLTFAGLEVDAIEPVVSEKVTNIVVGQITKIIKHPDADKLNICSVDVADSELLTIVCGAKDIYEGMKSPVAKIGAMLPGDFKITKSKLRGQDSFGMMCSEEELGLLDKANGLMDLPTDAPIGQDINEYLSLDDNIIEVDLTPNRADCLSVYGIAREVSALTKCKLKDINFVEHTVSIDDTKDISITAKDACKSYFGCIISDINTDVSTPLWMIEKLRRSGLKSNSLLVDVTNYVMLLTGQPMHAFDADKISGAINVRYAENGENITILDGSTTKLENDTLVIADADKVLAIAGVMGGLDSSITDSTKSIFLESAFFMPEKIAGKARKYNLHTDSSHRYERGVDPKLANSAMQLALEIILEIAGGKVGVITSNQDTDFINKPSVIMLCSKKLNKVLGTSFSLEYIESVLTDLHMKVTNIDDSCLSVIAPSYRFDMEIAEDLIEEVARVYGYSNLPETMPKYVASKIDISELKQDSFELESRLVDRGYHEAINYSFIDPKLDEFFFKGNGIAIKNPISQDLSVMRQSLIPGLMSTFKANISRQQNRVRIFEKGNCFDIKNNERTQYGKISGLVYGELNNISWSNGKIADFYDVKSDVEALCTSLNITFEVCDDVHWLHPGQSAYILDSGKRIGVIGVVHPKLLKLYQLKSKAPIVFEIDSDSLSSKTIPTFTKISKYPSVSRDISFLVDKNILAEDITSKIKSLDIKILKNIKIFDVYQDKENPRKSVALTMLFQGLDKTLEDDAIVKSTDSVLEILTEKFFIEQRA